MLVQFGNVWGKWIKWSQRWKQRQRKKRHDVNMSRLTGDLSKVEEKTTRYRIPSQNRVSSWRNRISSIKTWLPTYAGIFWQKKYAKYVGWLSSSFDAQSVSGDSTESNKITTEAWYSGIRWEGKLESELQTVTEDTAQLTSTIESRTGDQEVVHDSLKPRIVDLEAQIEAIKKTQ
jgi:hypothetical protein